MAWGEMQPVVSWKHKVKAAFLWRLIYLKCIFPDFESYWVFFFSQLLNAIQLFGANLDDYLHLLLPPIVKLFDAPDAPVVARK